MLQLLMLKLPILLEILFHTHLFPAPLSVFILAPPIPCIPLLTLLISVHHSLKT